MADLSLTGRQGPLDGRKGGSANVALTPAAPASRLALRARGDALKALSGALGVTLPEKPKASSSAGSRHALWLGPDEWLVIDEKPAADLMAAAAGADVLHSAVDISHRNTAIIISGVGAETTLSAGCQQDLSSEAFPVGACSRTLMAKAEIVIWRRGPEEYRVECWRSFSGYVFDFLSAAARDAAA